MSKKSPQLRFEGFTDDWEERKFESLLDKNEGVRRGPFGSALKKDLFVKESPYVVYEQQNAIYDHYETRYNISKEKFEELHKFELIADDFIMSGAGTIGRISKVPKGIKKGVFNQALIRFRINKELTDSEYFLQFIRADFMQRKLTGANPGSAITNLVPMSDVKKWEIKVPIKEEQKKIGSFFKQLDNTIALHQRKLDLLKEQKKGYLQKMFPKNGAKVPELRFAGFADDWEERKFKDNIVSIQTGTNLLGSTVNEGTPLIKMGNLQRGYFSFKKLEYLDSNSNVGSEDIVNYGDFLFNTRNTLELVGKGATWTGIGGKYAFNSNIARFKFDGIDTIFFNYLYNTQQVISQVHARAVGTTSVSAVYPRDLNSLLYYLPSIEEQQKIGSFFKQLDDTIALHQRKLDLLKEQKKGFLQKMFV